MLGLFVFPIIHRTLTWTTGSLTCVRDHCYPCVYRYTQGLGTQTASQHIIFDSEKLSQIFLELLMQAGFEHLVFGSWVRRCTNWATYPVTPNDKRCNNETKQNRKQEPNSRLYTDMVSVNRVCFNKGDLFFQHCAHIWFPWLIDWLIDCFKSS